MGVRIVAPGQSRRLPRGQARLSRGGASAALLVLATVAGMALLAPHLAPWDPTAADLAARLRPPAWAPGGAASHPLGTDQLGRDVLSRIMFGARISLAVGITSVGLGGIVGLLLGLVAGYSGGRFGTVVMRVADAQHAFPFIVIAIAVIAVAGPRFWNLIAVLAIWSWVPFARVAWAEVLSIKQLEYVDAARALGASHWRIMFAAILPRLVPSATVIWTVSAAQMITAEAALSFLGLGIPPPTPSWGGMLSDARIHISTSWWLATFPGLAIALTVLSINVLGDFLRDALDPKLGQGRIA